LVQESAIYKVFMYTGRESMMCRSRCEFVAWQRGFTVVQDLLIMYVLFDLV